MAVAQLLPPRARQLREATADARRPEDTSMRERKVHGNGLCVRITWMSLSGRSQGWETSSGGGVGAGGRVRVI